MCNSITLTKRLFAGLAIFVLAFFAGQVSAANLVTNPGFESGTTGWTTWGSTITATTAQKQSGSYSCLSTNRTQSYQGPVQSLLSSGMTPGVTYRLSGWVRLDNAATDVLSLTLQTTDSSGVNYWSTSAVTATNSGWTYIVGIYTMPAPTGIITGLNLYCSGAAAGVNFYLDDVSVTVVDGSDVCDMVFKSTGSLHDTTGWKMLSNGYIGTFITVSSPTTVTFTIKADGETANSVLPIMDLHVGDMKQSWSVTDHGGSHTTYSDYTTSLSFPAGTFMVRIEFTNDYVGGGQDRNLYVKSLTVTGTGAALLNSATSANALAAADTYIANYRKGTPTVILKDGAGNPLPANTTVHVKLTRHAFNFGTAVYGLDAASGDWLASNPPIGSNAYQYQQFLNTHFNTIEPENAGKWTYNEGTRDVLTMGFLDGIMSYAETHTMRVRMHGVLWDRDEPGWVNTLENTAMNGATQAIRDAAKADLRGQVTERIGYFVNDRASRYMELDGINESSHVPMYTDIYGLSGVAGIYNETATAAIAAGDKSRLYFNEYDVLNSANYANWYRTHIEDILNAGIAESTRARLGIGVQYYTTPSSHNPVWIVQSLYTLSVLGFPISLTEFGVGKDNFTSAPQILSETMRLVFGCDSATTFNIWGFWKPAIWADFNGAAMLDINWNLTDTGKVYEQMMGMQNWGIAGIPTWTTTDANFFTDSQGRISFNGFYGDYELTAGSYTYGLILTKGVNSYTVSPLTVISPNGGESLFVGQEVTINWMPTDFSFTNAKIEYSTDGGSTWTTVIASTSNTGSYLWTVPDAVSSSCLVRVSDVANIAISDTSDTDFTIYSCGLKADLNYDCKVDWQDLEILASNWLN